MGPFLCKGEEGGGGARVHHMSPNRSPILDATAFPSFCCLSSLLFICRRTTHVERAATLVWPPPPPPSSPLAPSISAAAADYGASERARSLFRLGGRGRLARVAVPRARAQRPRAWRPPRGGHRAHVVRRSPRAMPMHACLAASEPSLSSFFYPSQD